MALLNDTLAEFDRPYYQVGPFLIGVDEVGRGPLAGPVVACACYIPQGVIFEEINDSKKLSLKNRQKLCKQLQEHPQVVFSLAEASCEEIDQINIYHASRLAMIRALKALEVKLGRPFDKVLVDAMPLPEAPWPHEPIIKGDAKSQVIAAASILAKQARDELMQKLETRYPGYGLGKHMGYPTSRHIEALKKLGPTPIHRKSFGPVAQLLSEQLDFLAHPS